MIVIAVFVNNIAVLLTCYLLKCLYCLLLLLIIVVVGFCFGVKWRGRKENKEGE